MIRSCKLRAKKGRVEASICELDNNYLINLYTQEDGKCYYSGIQMNLTPHSDWKCLGSHTSG